MCSRSEWEKYRSVDNMGLQQKVPILEELDQFKQRVRANRKHREGKVVRQGWLMVEL